MRRRIHRAVGRQVMQHSRRRDSVVICLTLDCGHERWQTARRSELDRRLSQLDRGRPLACFTCLDGTTSALVEPGV